MYGFWLPLWYLQYFLVNHSLSFSYFPIFSIVLCILIFTASSYPFGIICLLDCLSFAFRLFVTPLVSFGHCIVCSSLLYGFWLSHWYLLTIVLSVLLCFTASDYLIGIFWPLYCLFFDLRLTTSGYLFGIFWPLYCLSFFALRLLIISLVSVDHCIVCSSLLYGFWLSHWYLLTIVLSVLCLTASDYPIGIFWPLYCLFFAFRLLVISLVSVDHCIVCSLPYGFWLSHWYLLTIVLSVLCLTASDYLIGIFWPLYCLFFALRLLIISLVSVDHCVVCSSLLYGFWLSHWYLLTIVLSVLCLTASDYLIGICWPLCCLFFFALQLLIISLVSFGHCIVCSLPYGFWLSHWYLLTIVLSVLLCFTASDYLIGICWPLCCLFFALRLLIISLVSFDHCIVCSLPYGFWLSHWYLLTIVLSVLLCLTASDYLIGIFWPLYCLFFALRLLIISLVSVDHCVVCSSLLYGFWLSHWYLLTIVLSVLCLTASGYLFGIFWPLYCLFFALRLLIISLVSVDHCIVCPSLLYGFWLSHWYLLAIVLSVLLCLTASGYLIGIFWPLYCLFFALRLLVISLVSVDHCIVCPSLLYGFWLSHWYLLAIVLSVLLCLTASDYLIGIFWPLCCLFFALRLLIISLVSFDHCIVCSLPYGFWLSHWYLLTIVLSVLCLTASDYLIGIFWPLYCLFFALPLLIISLVSFDHCVVCPSLPYGFWLSHWYLLTIVLSVLLCLTASDYLIGIFWPLCCLFFALRLLIISLVSFDHCIVCSLPYGFWLSHWYLLTIVLSVLCLTASDYLIGIFWPLYCLFFALRLLIISLVSFDHCVVCPSLPYGFWLSHWYLLTIVLSVLLCFTASDYLIGIFWPLYCLFFDLRLTASDYLIGICWPLYCLFFDLQLLIISLVSFDHCVVCSLIYSFWLSHWYLLTIVLSVLLCLTASGYLFGIFWPLYCLFFFDLQLLVISLVSFDHCVVCSSLIYSFWLSLWYLLTIVLSVLLCFTASDYLIGIFWPLYCLFFDLRLTASDYLIGICWPLCCLFFFALRLLIISLVSFDHCIVCSLPYGFWLSHWYRLTIVLSVLLCFTASDYLIGICWPLCCLFFALRLLVISLVSFGHCIVFSLPYGFWLSHWYLLTIVLSVLLCFTASGYLIGIFWPLYCLFFALRLLVISLVSVDHCIFCPSLLYGFWLSHWYLLAIVLSVLLCLTASDYLIGIFWPLCCLFFALRLLIISLVSFDHCIVCSLPYGFWLSHWYLLTIVLSVLCLTASDYLIGIFWPLYCLFFALRLLIISLVSFDHCVVCPSLPYGFWLSHWYLLTIVLSVLLCFTASDYLIGIFWPLYCLFFDLRLTASDYLIGICWPLYCLFFDLQLLIISLVSFDHCVVCSSLPYGFWLSLWYLLAIVLSVLLWFTASDYLIGIFWPLCCLFFFALRLLVISLVSFGHCIVCSSLLYGFWLSHWYLLTIVLSVLLWFTASDDLFGIFWPLYCLFFFALRLLIISLVSFDHCIVCSLIYGLRLLIISLVSVDHFIVCSLIYSFWLSHWYLLTIVLSVLLCFTASDYLIGIFWPLYCLFFDLRLTASDYLIGICWPLYCLFFDLQLLIISLVSFDHCVVCSLIYSFWLSHWYLLTIVLSVLLCLTASGYLFGIFWPLYCLFFFDLQLLVISLVSFDHCVVCSSLIYSFWLSLWYLLTIVLSVLLCFTASDYLIGIFWPLYCLFFDLRLTASDYLIGICWPLCCLFFFALRLLIISLVSFDHCIVCSLPYGFWLSHWYRLTIVLSVLLCFTASDYLIGICWPLCCLFFALRLLVISLVSFGHCIVFSLPYGFWLSHWYLLTIVLSVLLCFTASGYLIGIFWPLYCLFFALRLLVISLVSVDHCIFCPSLLYGFWLSHWYLLAIVLSVLLCLTASDYLIGIFWPLCCLFFALRLLIISLVSFDHCIVCSLPYGFWLSHWYLLTIVLSVLCLTASDYLIGIFWPLYCLFFALRLLIISLVSFDHCVVCPSLPYGFWLSHWYLLTIVLSVLLCFTASDYLIGIFWPLYCLFFDLRLTASDYLIGICWPLYCLFFDLQLLIISLVSFDHCVVCSSLPYGFWLSLWYLLAIVLSVLLWFTASDYLIGIFWPLCCLFFFALRLLVISLVSFGHCIVCSSLLYGFWLSHWYLLTIVLSVLLWFTASDDLFGIFWPLYCLFFFALRLLIISLVSFDHCIVCSLIYGLRLLIISLVSVDHFIVCSLIYSFWLSHWYLLTIVLSVLLWNRAPGYPFVILLSPLFTITMPNVTAGGIPPPPSPPPPPPEVIATW